MVYPTLEKEKNYLFNLGYTIDFNQLESYQLTSGISIPWFTLPFLSEFQASHLHHPFLSYQNFLIYHRFDLDPFRFYTRYDFDYFPALFKPDNHRFANGINFLISKVLLSFELKVVFNENGKADEGVDFLSQYAFVIFMVNNHHLGVKLSQEGLTVLPTFFLQINFGDVFINLSYAHRSHSLSFTIDFIHQVVRLQARAVHQNGLRVGLANHFYFLPHEGEVFSLF